MLTILRSRNVLISLAALLGAIYLGADSQQPLASSSEHGVRRVRVAEAATAAERRELSFSGTTRSVRHSRLSFSIGGRLTARPIEVGDRVRRGQTLARIDERELQNAVATARGALAELTARRAQAERDLERAERLLAAKAATTEELERVRAGLDAVSAAEDAARSRLDEALRRVDETRLEAPYSGTVTEIFFEPGEYAGAGRAVLTLSGDGDLELEVEVPESVVPQVEKGVEVDVSVPLIGRSVSAKIDSVGRTAAGPGRLFPVVARIPESSGVVVGATAALRLSLEADDALAVPVEAVVNPGGRRPALFRVVGQGETRVEKIQVEVGSLLGDQVTVRAQSAGLAAGDRVVVGGQRGLLDGEIVILQEGNAP